ncbi:MAG: PhzF family phenazine biosynthesis protein [Bryobacter sp.]|nr:PhzF family phenazine biosynthesis protein [Bryobacter sp. CoA8 C33]
MQTRRGFVEGEVMQMAERELRYEVWDVFTGKAYGGNPLGVFFAPRGLRVEEMYALTREMNHSETTFVDGAGKVRIFTATQELPFAGHPVLGTAFALRRKSGGGNRVVVEAPQGPIEVDFEGETGMMRQAKPEFRERHEAGVMAPMLGVEAGGYCGPGGECVDGAAECDCDAEDDGGHEEGEGGLGEADGVLCGRGCAAGDLSVDRGDAGGGLCGACTEADAAAGGSGDGLGGGVRGGVSGEAWGGEERGGGEGGAGASDGEAERAVVERGEGGGRGSGRGESGGRSVLVLEGKVVAKR